MGIVWSYTKRKDLCDDHSEMSGNSYLADQLTNLPPGIDILWPRVEVTFARHHGKSIMGCIWQPLWILENKVRICFNFSVIIRGNQTNNQSVSIVEC